MIEKQPMKIEDFLLIMEMNTDSYPEWLMLTEEQKRYLANVNIITGTAESFYENGRLVGVGGIRHIGVGEAWMITPPDVRGKRSLSLFRKTKETFTKTRDDLNLWRCFAESKISDNFLNHLGFEPNPKGLVWTRT